MSIIFSGHFWNTMNNEWRYLTTQTCIGKTWIHCFSKHQWGLHRKQLFFFFDWTVHQFQGDSVPESLCFPVSPACSFWLSFRRRMSARGCGGKWMGTGARMCIIHCVSCSFSCKTRMDFRASGQSGWCTAWSFRRPAQTRSLLCCTRTSEARCRQKRDEIASSEMRRETDSACC